MFRNLCWNWILQHQKKTATEKKKRSWSIFAEQHIRSQQLPVHLSFHNHHAGRGGGMDSESWGAWPDNAKWCEKRVTNTIFAVCRWFQSVQLLYTQFAMKNIILHHIMTCFFINKTFLIRVGAVSRVVPRLTDLSGRCISVCWFCANAVFWYRPSSSSARHRAVARRRKIQTGLNVWSPFATKTRTFRLPGCV